MQRRLPDPWHEDPEIQMQKEFPQASSLLPAKDSKVITGIVLEDLVSHFRCIHEK